MYTLSRSYTKYIFAVVIILLLCLTRSDSHTFPVFGLKPDNTNLFRARMSTQNATTTTKNNGCIITFFFFLLVEL